MISTMIKNKVNRYKTNEGDGDDHGITGSGNISIVRNQEDEEAKIVILIMTEMQLHCQTAFRIQRVNARENGWVEWERWDRIERRIARQRLRNMPNMISW